MAADEGLSLNEAARRAGTTPNTLRRWAEQGLIPGFDGHWTAANVAHARIVSRLRARGHTLTQIRSASDAGRLAFGYVEDLFPAAERGYSLEDVAEAAGL